MNRYLMLLCLLCITLNAQCSQYLPFVATGHARPGNALPDKPARAVEEKKDCTICAHEMNQTSRIGIRLLCHPTHEFCHSCLLRLTQEDPKCPFCRKPLRLSNAGIKDISRIIAVSSPTIKEELGCRLYQMSELEENSLARVRQDQVSRSTPIARNNARQRSASEHANLVAEHATALYDVLRAQQAAERAASRGGVAVSQLGDQLERRIRAAERAASQAEAAALRSRQQADELEHRIRDLSEAESQPLPGRGRLERAVQGMRGLTALVLGGITTIFVFVKEKLRGSVSGTEVVLNSVNDNVSEIKLAGPENEAFDASSQVNEEYVHDARLQLRAINEKENSSALEAALKKNRRDRIILEIEKTLNESKDRLSPEDVELTQAVILKAKKADYDADDLQKVVTTLKRQLLVKGLA